MDEWAKEAGYRLSESDDSRRRYYKGNLVHVPVWLDIQQTGDDVHLEAWVKSTAVPMSLWSYLMPDEMVLESGGLVGVTARLTGRKAINNLLERLSQPPIL